MVATVIMVVLVGLVIQITSEVLKVWNRSSGKLSANAEARIAMDLLTQDLETAVFRNNDQQWLRVEAPRETGASDKIQSNEQTVALKLFSPALDRADDVAGDICAIGYRLAYQQSYAGGNDVYALYRRIVDPKTTFDNYMSSGTDEERSQGTLEAPGKGTADWSDTSIQEQENYLAGNIVEFKVFVYLDNGDVEPVNVTDGTFDLNADYAYGGIDGTTTPVLYADIVLTVVSDEGLKILEQGKFTGTGFAGAADVVKAHGDSFVRRVNFLARPL